MSAQGYTNATGTSATLQTLQGLNVLKAFSPAWVATGKGRSRPCGWGS